MPKKWAGEFSKGGDQIKITEWYGFGHLFSLWSIRDRIVV